MSNNAIVVDSVWKNFRLYHERNQHLKAAILRGRRARYEEFWALQDVSLEIPHGATFGLIGSNGSGKSTLLKCLAKILYPNKGSVTVSGRLSALLELGAGFHPEMTGAENVLFYSALMGRDVKTVKERTPAIGEWAGVSDHMDFPLRTFSSGMVARLAFATATDEMTDVLLVDEVLSVGDADFQEKSKARMHELINSGAAVVLVSHDMSAVRELATRAIWLENGHVKMIGKASDVVDAYEAN